MIFEKNWKGFTRVGIQEMWHVFLLFLSQSFLSVLTVFVSLHLSNMFEWALPNTPWYKLTCPTRRMLLYIPEIILTGKTHSYRLTTLEIARKPKISRGTSLFERLVTDVCVWQDRSNRDRHSQTKRGGIERMGREKEIHVRKLRPRKFSALERMALPDSTHGLWCRIWGFSLHAFLDV